MFIRKQTLFLNNQVAESRLEQMGDDAYVVIADKTCIPNTQIAIS